MGGLCKIPGCPEEATFPLSVENEEGVIVQEVGLCADHFAWFVRGHRSGADMRPVMEQLFLQEYENEA